MKRFFIFIQFLLLTIAANATAQDSDIIYIDGMRWELLGRPVCANSKLYRQLKAVLPTKLSTTSANWDGFTAYWSIKQDMLYLDSIRCEYYDIRTKRIPADTLFHVFKKYVAGENIVAGWLTGKIRVGKGEIIYYDYEFQRHYEEEQVISIKKGKVSKKKEYHNYVIDGFSFDNVRDNSELRRLFPIHIENYPELANAKYFYFGFRKAHVDSKGRLVKCKVEADNPRLAAELAQLFKAYHPWKVWYVNGEYRAYGLLGWSIPYFLDK